LDVIKAHFLRLSVLVCRKELVCERALHGTAVPEHAVVSETGRQTLQGLLNDRILLSDDVVVPVFPPPAKVSILPGLPDGGAGDVAAVSKGSTSRERQDRKGLMR